MSPRFEIDKRGFGPSISSCTLESSKPQSYLNLSKNEFFIKWGTLRRAENFECRPLLR